MVQSTIPFFIPNTEQTYVQQSTIISHHFIMLFWILSF